MARLAEGDKKKQGKRGREGAFLEAEGELRRGTEDFKRILLRVLAWGGSWRKREEEK